LDQLLQGKAGTARPYGAGGLPERLRRSLDEIRRRYERAKGLAAQDRLANALHATEDAGAPDPVLRFAIARHEGLTAQAEVLHREALDRYYDEPESYDGALGIFLPEDFRTEARWVAANHAYHGGANPTARDDWPVYRAGLAQRQTSSLRGLATGLPGLDAASGGLHGLTFLGGETGTGKTTLALTVAVAALRRHPDLAALYLSLDMPKERLYDRLLCHEAGIRHADLVGGANGGRLDEADSRLRAEVLPRLRVVSRRAFDATGPLTATAVGRHRDELLETSKARRALVVVDYFHLLRPPADLVSPADADAWRLELLQSLQGYGYGADTPDGDAVLAISEVRKGEHGRPALTVSDLMGSARLGYAADAVWLLEPLPGPADAETVRVALTIAKGRDGVRRSRLELLYEHTRSRFSEAGLGPADHLRGSRNRQAGTAAAPLDPLAGLGEDKP
jgi:hypothetical protein